MSPKLNFSRLSLECVSTLRTLLPSTGLLGVLKWGVKYTYNT